MSNNRLPLEGIRVVEYANFVAAPICGRLLADWGAEVIKIEPTFGDMMRVVGVQWCFPSTEDECPMFEFENSGKKDIVIDTNSKEGVELIYKLLEKSDVFLTNTRQKSLDKSGLNYEEVKKRCPHIIYAHLLGYGENGPAKDNPAFDYTAYYARGGVALSLMEKDTSPCNPVAGMGDHYAGMSLSAGVLAALRNRDVTGKGDRVTVSLFHTAVFGMGIMVAASQYGYKMPISRRTPPNPITNTYKCKDGRWIQIAFFQYEKWFPNFCNIVIERPDLIGTEYATLKTALKTGTVFIDLLEEIFAQKDSQEWCERLQKAGIPYEMLATPEDVLNDEQCWANDFLLKHTYDSGNEGVIFNTPVMFTEVKREYKRAPRFAEHTDELLKEIGITDEQISKMKEAGIVK